MADNTTWIEFVDQEDWGLVLVEPARLAEEWKENFMICANCCFVFHTSISLLLTSVFCGLLTRYINGTVGRIDRCIFGLTKRHTFWKGISAEGAVMHHVWIHWIYQQLLDWKMLETRQLFRTCSLLIFKRYLKISCYVGFPWSVIHIMQMLLSMFYRKFFQRFNVFLGKNVFGVPLSVNLQRIGHPLPKPILCAISYLRRTGIIQYTMYRYYS